MVLEKNNYYNHKAPRRGRDRDKQESTAPRGLSLLRVLPELFLRVGVQVNSYFYNLSCLISTVL